MAIRPSWDMVGDLVDIMRSEIRALSDDGVSYFQLDSLLYVLDLPRPAADASPPDFDGDFLDLMIERTTPASRRRARPA